MTDTVKEEIQRARGELDLPVSQFRELPESEAQVVFNAAETHFVSSRGRRCWWEDFRHPATKVAFPNHKGFEYLDRIVPSPNDLLWFIAEGDSLAVHTVYEAKVAQIQSVIGECSFFEYYIMPKDFRWLVCESHHDVVFAIGPEVEERLRETEI